MEQHNEIRVWFCEPKNEDELQESISFLKGLSEEILLGKTKFRIELYVERRLPQN